MYEELRTAYGDRRLTAPRAAIARTASGLTDAFTVEDLASLVRETDASAGATATVYRAVAAMEAAGYVDAWVPAGAAHSTPDAAPAHTTTTSCATAAGASRMPTVPSPSTRPLDDPTASWSPAMR